MCNKVHISKKFKVAQKFMAFTLAEVLITLGIIGIVAAMTLPSLVGNYKKIQTVLHLKKVYSSLLQSVEFSKAEYGDLTVWEWDLSSAEFFKKYLGKSLKTFEVCQNTGLCWNEKTFLISGTQYTGHPNNISFILADGTIIFIEKQDDFHMHIWVDINGLKSPNTFGKDIFVLTLVGAPFKDPYHLIAKPGLYMFGHGLNRQDVISNGNGCSKDKTGISCSELILMDGWEIKNDYPW